MEEKRKAKDKWFMKILLVSGLIVLISSLEAFMMAKDRSLFEIFLKNNKTIKTFSDYLNLVLLNYIFSIAIPLVITIYTYLTLDKYGLNFSTRPFLFYRIFFGGMVLIQIVNMVLRFSVTSIFYYINIVLYFALLILVTRKPKRGEK
ncbi:MAG: hypothetical protein PUG67_08880 [Peptoniphilaceae bacterium]|nr:hypothetical protein [Peptoniphilaceae bacterium]MDY6018332.1 hypothetical protein [Anaerococcus sp.]